MMLNRDNRDQWTELGSTSDLSAVKVSPPPRRRRSMNKDSMDEFIRSKDLLMMRRQEAASKAAASKSTEDDTSREELLPSDNGSGEARRRRSSKSSTRRKSKGNNKVPLRQSLTLEDLMLPSESRLRESSRQHLSAPTELTSAGSPMSDNSTKQRRRKSVELDNSIRSTGGRGRGFRSMFRSAMPKPIPLDDLPASLSKPKPPRRSMSLQTPTTTCDSFLLHPTSPSDVSPVGAWNQRRFSHNSNISPTPSGEDLFQFAESLAGSMHHSSLLNREKSPKRDDSVTGTTMTKSKHYDDKTTREISEGLEDLRNRSLGQRERGMMKFPTEKDDGFEASTTCLQLTATGTVVKCTISNQRALPDFSGARSA